MICLTGRLGDAIAEPKVIEQGPGVLTRAQTKEGEVERDTGGKISASAAE